MRPDRRIGRTVLSSVALAGLVTAITLLYSSGSSGSEDRTVIVMLINMMLVLSLQMFTGNTGVLSFGHLIFPSVAGYTSAILTTTVLLKESSLSGMPFGLASVHLEFLPALAVAVAVATVVAVALGFIIIRVSGLGAAILSLALLVVLHRVFTNWDELTGGARGFYGISEETTITLCLVAVFIAILLSRVFKDSLEGLRAQAGREDELAARAIGIDVRRTRFKAWVLSATLGAAAGVLLVHHIVVITPDEFFLDLTLIIVTFLFFGGMTSVTGAVVGTMVLTALLETSRKAAEGPVWAGIDLPEISGLSQMCLGLVIVLVMIKRPEGLFGDRELEDFLPARFARRAPTLGAQQESEGPKPEAGHIRADGVRKTFAGVIALDGVSCEVRPGEVVGVIGPNGAGKTTLLNVLSGNIPPTEGEVTLNGDSLLGLPTEKVARAGVARTFQNQRLFEHLSLRDNVEAAYNVAKRWRKDRVRIGPDELLARFGLDKAWDQPALSLPQGDRRRLEMARALALAPSVVLFDEPTSGMNVVEAQDLRERLEKLRDEEGCSMLIVDHSVPFVMKLCDRIYVLDSGKLLAVGTPEEIQADAAVGAAYLGHDPGTKPARRQPAKSKPRQSTG